MAKAADVTLDAGAPFGDAAVHVVGVRARELFEHADGVLDTGDIERVHAMRVATRRLRAVLEIFAPCFDPDLHRSVLREVKELADGLGARRDPDVQLEELAKVADAMGEGERAGLELLAERWRRVQLTGNETLAAALEHARGIGLEQRLEELVA